MNHTIKLLFASIVSVTLLAPIANAGKFIESRTAKKSDYYKGSSTLPIQAVSHHDWLTGKREQRKKLQLQYQGFLLEDPRATQYVYDIANNLLNSWPGATPDLHLFVIAQSADIVYSAETSGENEIFLFNGVLAQAKSEDEVAAVIAHELAHVLLGHAKSLNYKSTLTKYSNNFADNYGVYQDTDTLTVDDETGMITEDQEEKRQAEEMKKKVADRQEKINKTYGSMHGSMFSRPHELEADKLAVDLLVASGYSPLGLQASLGRLSASYNLATLLQNALLEQAQQVLDEQKENLKAWANGEKSKEEAKGEARSLFKDLKAKLKPAAREAAQRKLAESHPAPEKRVSQTMEYIFAEYGRKVRRRPLKTASIEELKAGPLGVVLDNNAAATIALQQLLNEELQEAEANVLRAISGPTADAPYSRYVAYRLRLKQGKADTALLNLQKLNPDSWLPIDESIEMAESYLQANKHEQVQSIIQRNEDYFGRIDSYYPLKIRVSLLGKDLDGAEKLARDCEKKADDQQSLVETCLQLAGLTPSEPEKKGLSKFVSKSKGLFNSLKSD